MQCSSKHKFPEPFQTADIEVDHVFANFSCRSTIYKCFISDFWILRNSMSILHYQNSLKQGVPVFQFTKLSPQYIEGI